MVVQAGAQLLGLEVDEAAVRSQLDQVALDLLGDAPDHFAGLEHGHHVAHRDGVLHLEAGQRAERVVEARAEALEGGQGLARAVDQPAGRLGGVLLVVAVDGDGGHGLGDRDDGHVDGAGHPLGRAVTGARLRRGDGGLGHQVHVGPGDARGVGGENDGAVHLGQLGEPLGAVLGIEQEPAGADREHGRIVPHDDQRPVFRLEDPVEALPQRSARCDQGQRVVQRLAGAVTVDHGANRTRRPCRGRPAARR